MRRGRRQVAQLGQSHEKLWLAHFSAPYGQVADEVAPERLLHQHRRRGLPRNCHVRRPVVHAGTTDLM
jgi:hypothetical protein